MYMATFSQANWKSPITQLIQGKHLEKVFDDASRLNLVQRENIL